MTICQSKGANGPKQSAALRERLRIQQILDAGCEFDRTDTARFLALYSDVSVEVATFILLATPSKAEQLRNFPANLKIVVAQ